MSWLISCEFLSDGLKYFGEAAEAFKHRHDRKQKRALESAEGGETR